MIIRAQFTEPGMWNINVYIITVIAHIFEAVKKDANIIRFYSNICFLHNSYSSFSREHVKSNRI